MLGIRMQERKKGEIYKFLLCSTCFALKQEINRTKNIHNVWENIIYVLLPPSGYIWSKKNEKETVSLERTCCTELNLSFILCDMWLYRGVYGHNRTYELSGRKIKRMSQLQSSNNRIWLSSPSFAAVTPPPTK